MKRTRSRFSTTLQSLKKDVPDTILTRIVRAIMRPTLKSRVQRRLSELQRTAAEATRLGGLSRTIIYDILDGRRTHVRTDTAVKLALALDCDVSYLTGEQPAPRADESSALHKRVAAVSQVRVLGEVAAGIWHESAALGVYDLDLPLELDAYPPVPVVLDPRYEGFGQFAVLVKGTSVNKVIPDGFFAVCVPYWDVRGEPRDGDLVVVERIRAGLHEGTVKRLKKSPSGWELRPESDDPRHQAPIPLSEKLDAEREDPDTTVQIAGLVIWIGAPVS